MSADPEPLLTYREIADRLHVSLRTAQRYGRNGRLDVIRLSSQTHRIPESSLARLLEHSSSTPGTQGAAA